MNRIRKPRGWRARLMKVTDGRVTVAGVIDPQDPTRLFTLGPCPLCGHVGKTDSPQPFVIGHAHGNDGGRAGTVVWRAGHCLTYPNYSGIGLVSVERAIALAPRGWMNQAKAVADLKRVVLIDLASSRYKAFTSSEAMAVLMHFNFIEGGGMWHRDGMNATVRLLRELVRAGQLEVVPGADEFGPRWVKKR